MIRALARDTHNMTCIRLVEFLLSLLLLHQVCSEEPEPVFRTEGSVIEMGYCFGVDYILVYRSAQDGDQLLGNSSNKDMPNTPPADLQGRTHISGDHDLLGLRISKLTHMDSGIYRRECWQNQTLVSQHTQQLYVCNEEIESEEIIPMKEGGEAELSCNSTSIGLEGTSVRWYHETYPDYNLTLFLDSSVSLEPLVEKLLGVVEVRDRGALLVLDSSLLKDNHHFYCLVIKGTNCLSFQNMYPPDPSETRNIFASQGDRVILNCPVDGSNQHWRIPQGKIPDNSSKNNQMYLSAESEDFSLIIPVITNEHSGEYSCISSSFEIQYSLVLCSKTESQNKTVYEGGIISLQCSLDQHSSQKVQWYRHELSGQDELIHDTKDETIATPDDLRGRLTLSENGSSLIISDLKMKDGGEYWCVVLKNAEFLEGDGDFNLDYDEEGTAEAEYSDGEYWPFIQQCILKQMTYVTISVKEPGKDVNVPPLTGSTGIYTTATPSDASNFTAYAVVGGVVGLLVGAIVAGVVMKKRAQRQATSRSAGHTTATIHLHEDPGCTENLTNHDDDVA